MSIYFLLYRVSRFFALLSPNPGFTHTSICPYIHPWHWIKYHSILNCLASHDLLVIKLGYFCLAGLATWYKLAFWGFGVHFLLFTGCSRYSSVLTFRGTFLISCFLLQNLSEWLVIQVGYFSHRKCPESIIPYQLFVFTQLNLCVGLAHLGEILTQC